MRSLLFPDPRQKLRQLESQLEELSDRFQQVKKQLENFTGDRT